MMTESSMQYNATANFYQPQKRYQYILEPERNEIIADKTRFNGDYNEYLRSRYWRLVKETVFRRDHFACVVCKSQDFIVPHHLHYKHVRNELKELSCLVTLCADCHADNHQNLAEIQRSTIGSRHRLVLLFKTWKTIDPRFDYVLQNSLKVDVSLGQIKTQADLSSSFLVDSLWPLLSDSLACTKHPALYKLPTFQIYRKEDGLQYRDDKNFLHGRSMTEAVLSFCLESIKANDEETRLWIENEQKRKADELHKMEQKQKEKEDRKNASKHVFSDESIKMIQDILKDSKSPLSEDELRENYRLRNKGLMLAKKNKFDSEFKWFLLKGVGKRKWVVTADNLYRLIR